MADGSRRGEPEPRAALQKPAGPAGAPAAQVQRQALDGPERMRPGCFLYSTKVERSADGPRCSAERVSGAVPAAARLASRRMEAARADEPSAERADAPQVRRHLAGAVSAQPEMAEAALAAQKRVAKEARADAVARRLDDSAD